MASIGFKAPYIDSTVLEDGSAGMTDLTAGFVATVIGF